MRVHTLLPLLLLAGAMTSAGTTTDLEGAWRNSEDPTVLVRFRGDDLYVLMKGNQFHWHVEYAPDHFTLSDLWGWTQDFPYELPDEDRLEVDFKFRPGTYLRMDGIPDELLVAPITFGTAQVDTDEVARLRQELARRVALDQSIREELNEAMREGAAPEDILDRMSAIDQDNRRWLIDIVLRIGWIDSERFGPGAANDAFLIVQHSQYLPLMRAALSAIRAEVAAGHITADGYALLFDRTQLKQGHPQRYGTQVRVFEGEAQLFPIESLEKAEELRAELGMRSLADYLAAIEDQVGAPVTIPE